jgi:hypothetical protein
MHLEDSPLGPSFPHGFRLIVGRCQGTRLSYLAVKLGWAEFENGTSKRPLGLGIAPLVLYPGSLSPLVSPLVV